MSCEPVQSWNETIYILTRTSPVFPTTSDTKIVPSIKTPEKPHRIVNGIAGEAMSACNCDGTANYFLLFGYCVGVGVVAIGIETL